MGADHEGTGQLTRGSSPRAARAQVRQHAEGDSTAHNEPHASSPSAVQGVDQRDCRPSGRDRVYTEGVAYPWPADGKSRKTKKEKARRKAIPLATKLAACIVKAFAIPYDAAK